MNVILLTPDERIPAIRRLMPKAGSALDIGCGNTFRSLYADRQYRPLLALNPFEPSIVELRREFSRDGWEFRVQDVREYEPDCLPFRLIDVATMLHVAEHLDLWDLGRVLDRLVGSVGVFILETPEQYDDNSRSAEERQNPHEYHRSLVTADYLARWGFSPEFRYWTNERFSNAIYVRRA